MAIYLFLSPLFKTFFFFPCDSWPFLHCKYFQLCLLCRGTGPGIPRGCCVGNKWKNRWVQLSRLICPSLLRGFLKVNNANNKKKRICTIYLNTWNNWCNPKAWDAWGMLFSCEKCQIQSVCPGIPEPAFSVSCWTTSSKVSCCVALEGKDPCFPSGVIAFVWKAPSPKRPEEPVPDDRDTNRKDLYWFNGKGIF